MNTKIFQIYFKPEQKEQMDSSFVPYDNTNNPQPQIQEWYIWNEYYKSIEAGAEEAPDYWGFFSWRFNEKTNLTGQQVQEWIDANPGYDVYLINPAIVNEAVFANGWEQGDYYHPGLSDSANDFLARAGYKDIDVTSMLMDRTRMGFATYIVASRNFWQNYMDLSRKIFDEAGRDAEFKHHVFGEGLSGYSRDNTLPMFPFLNERLVGTYMELGNYKVLPYIHSDNTIASKYAPVISDVRALSDLKVLINQYDSDELYNIWDHFRKGFLQKNQGVLNLE